MRNRRAEIEAKVKARTLEVWCESLQSYCWEWTGPSSGSGRGGDYARMCLDGQTVAVHRVMFTNTNGFIPGKKQIDHKCRNRRCVNPDHLEMVTHKQNQKRRDNARKGAAV